MSQDSEKNQNNRPEGDGIKKVAIACQGGGSHTAFTAGVLMEIIEWYKKEIVKDENERKYEIIGLSGTSGGAICATLAWCELFLDGGKSNCQGLLQKFWDRNKAKPFPTFSSLMPYQLSRMWIESLPLNQWLLFLKRMSSFMKIDLQYDPAWFDREIKDYLRELFDDIKFDQINHSQAKESLFVGAIDVNTGSFKVFKREELEPESLLASAAIPDLFEAVTIKKKGKVSSYWDGLYAENPPLRCFFDPDYKRRDERVENLSCEQKKLLPEEIDRWKKKQKRKKNQNPDEIWLIRVNPRNRESGNLISIPEKRDRQNELAGNLSLEQELASIAMINDLIAHFQTELEDYYNPVCCPEIKMDEGKLAHESINLDYVSKLDRAPYFIDALLKHGKERASEFLIHRGIVKRDEVLKQ